MGSENKKYDFKVLAIDRFGFAIVNIPCHVLRKLTNDEPLTGQSYYLRDSLWKEWVQSLRDAADRLEKQ